MSGQSWKFAIPVLRWTVGLVVLYQSCRFAFSHGPLHGGMPAWIRPVLGGPEILAAILFLVPPTRVVGGYLLLIIFAVAIIIHVLHGDYDVSVLLLYAAAVLATMQKDSGARL